MRRKTIFVENPSVVLVILAGAVATILVTALVYLAPVLGLPLVDIPFLIGGLWTGDADAALASGYAVVFMGGCLVLPLVLKLVWEMIPGDAVAFRGALVKGGLLGVVTWLMSGVLLGLVSLTDPVPGVAEPGWFALSLGLAGAAVLLVTHLVYGTALALIAAMGQGLSPVNAFGWGGHGAGRDA